VPRPERGTKQQGGEKTSLRRITKKKSLLWSKKGKKPGSPHFFPKSYEATADAEEGETRHFLAHLTEETERGFRKQREIAKRRESPKDERSPAPSTIRGWNDTWSVRINRKKSGFLKNIKLRGT